MGEILVQPEDLERAAGSISAAGNRVGELQGEIRRWLTAGSPAAPAETRAALEAFASSWVQGVGSVGDEVQGLGQLTAVAGLLYELADRLR